MMLAMVIDNGGVWVFNPYISDFEDNTNWNAANGIADRLEDRIDVGMIYLMALNSHKFSMRSSMLQGVNLNCGQGADLTASDIIHIYDYTSSSFTRKCKPTAEKVIIQDENGINEFNIDSNGVVTQLSA